MNPIFKRYFYCLFILYLSVFLIACSPSPVSQTPLQSANKPDTVVQVKAAFSGMVKSLNKSEVAQNLYRWNLLAARQWEDADGLHILTVSRSDRKLERQDEYMNEFYFVEMQMRQYAKTGDGYRLEWQAHDHVRDCLFDMWMGLVGDAIFVTDMDSNGHAETTLIYSLSCRSDISPAEMKLLMYEKGEKMALRGSMFLEIAGALLNRNTFNPDLSALRPKPQKDDYEKLFGRYEHARDFKNKPESFLKFAKNKWLEYCTQDSFGQF